MVGPGIGMRPLRKGLGLPPDNAMTLKPRGYHLPDRAQGAAGQGQRLAVTLMFEKAGSMDVECLVEAAGPVGNEVLVEDRQPG